MLPGVEQGEAGDAAGRDGNGHRDDCQPR